MSRGLSDFADAIAAWLCLVSVAFARKPLSMSSTIVPMDGSAELSGISGKSVQPAHRVITPLYGVLARERAQRVRGL